ncbi:MAG: superoxide dismutase [Mycobacteriaceae bacterium]|nr:superoxide dismutase [Mycobacteriaceae bacterium]
MTRVLAAVALAAWLGAAVPVPGHAGPLFPADIDLPAGFQPEGIAVGAQPVAYLGSRSDGTILRVDLVCGRTAVVSPGQGAPALGMRLDARGRLFVAGGAAGEGRVLDAGTGAVLARYQFAAPPDTLVNDVVLTPEGAWFTDSRAPVLYFLPIARDGALPPPAAVLRRPLTGDIRYVPGAFNANGIATTPDGSGLIIVQSATGALYRVNPRTGATRRVDIGRESVPDGDGLLREDHTLYVVESSRNTVAVVHLAADGAGGELVRLHTDRRFDTPTTMARYAGRIYLPNARFTATQAPAAVHHITAIDP